jgi:RHS repeat-associated protein
VTTVTYPPALQGDNSMTEGYTWDYFLGKPLSHTDANGQVASYAYENSASMLDRLLTITAPGDGATTSYVYCDVALVAANADCPSDSSVAAQRPSVLAKQDQVTVFDGVMQARTVYDGLGRVSATLKSAPTGLIYVSKTSDAVGQVVTATNPVYGTGTAGCAANDIFDTTYGYDTLGRVISATTCDGAAVNTSYNGLTTTATDQAGASRTMVADGLGRMTSVLDGSGVTTYYQYDLLDDLVAVCQGAAFGSGGACPSGSQGRTFTYDGLRRLQTASNPETGNASGGDTAYTYDGNGDMLTRTMAVSTNPSRLTITYDALNRPSLKAYTQHRTAPNVTLCYDGKVYGNSGGACTAGSAPNAKMRLTQVWNSASTTVYTGYDARGRITGYQQQTPIGGPTYGFTGFAYNLASGMTSITYPSGRTVTQTFDTAGRVAGIPGYASPISYEAHGGITSLTLGNQLIENWTYNPERMQPEMIQLGSSSNPVSVVALETSYCDANFDVIPSSRVTCTNNNGNVKMDRITVGSTAWARRYQYDPANRLTQANEYSGVSGSLAPASPACPDVDVNSVWCQQYGYHDNFGNRLITARSGLTPAGNEPQSFDPATNRVTGQYWQYDETGNVIEDGAQMTASYDGENRLVIADGTTCSSAPNTTCYGYDGAGQRVSRTMGGQITTFVYSPDGQLVAEYGSPVPAVTGREYLTADNLGTTRVVTDTSGTPVERADYLPFGEQILVSHGSARYTIQNDQSGYGLDSDVKVRFTGKERDAETGLDYFLARYLSSGQGRFTSPDPIFFQKEMLADPQRWNLYVYARNNPLLFVDPKGEAIELLGSQEDRNKELAALRSGLGNQAGVYLYENKVTTKDADGNETTKYYVGIYTNGPDADGPAFNRINGQAAGLAAIINSPEVVGFDIVRPGKESDVPIPIGSMSDLNSPGASGLVNGQFRVWILDPSIDPGQVPADQMKPQRPGSADSGIIALHEMGHIGSLMGVLVPLTSEKSALHMENLVRKMRDPAAPIRVSEKPPHQ